jgi:Protein of unknown function (DUF2878)
MTQFATVAAPPPAAGKGLGAGAWRTILFAVLWQAAWFAAVIPAGKGLPWIGLLAAVPVVIVAGYDRWWRTGFVILIAIAVGLIVDASLAAAGVVGYPHGLLDGRCSPPWMWALWLQLGLALDWCLTWLRRRWWLPVLFGAGGAPGAYLGGVAFGALVAPQGSLPLALAVGVAYAVALPLIIRLTAKGAP